MSQIYFLNQPTRANLVLARKHLHSCFRLVKQGKDKAALKYANRACIAYARAMQQCTEEHHAFPKTGVA